MTIQRIEKSRIICLNGEITSELAMEFNIMLLAMEQEAPGEAITLYLNSPGGEVLAGLSMIDTMNLISCPIHTVCIGLAASMAAMILMSGEKGHRRILPHSEVVIHQPLGSLYGTMQATEIEIVSSSIIKTRDSLYQIIHDCTGQPLEKIAVDCDRDYRLSALEAIEYGIVDSVISKNSRRER